MMINFRSASLIIILALGLLVATSGAQQCGTQYPNCNCPEGYCCSTYGYCGKSDAYCGTGNCQCQCPAPSPPPPPPPPPPPYVPPPPPSPEDVSNIVSKDLFEEMLLHRNDNDNCAIGFYTYEGFITAARRFPEFGATGTLEDRKREIAAFFGQTSHETTGGAGWPDAPDGPYTWGYCYNRELGTPPGYCVPSTEWPCVPGQDYYGRGPIQISYNYNYGPAGAALGLDLLSNPDLVATDIVVSFETALWFWVTVQAPKPSCHDVITGQWTPSQADKDANRLPGYGLLTNIINGGLECGHGPDDRVEDRIGFYLRYCELLGVSPGDNLDCYNQTHYGVTLRNNNLKYGILKMPVDMA
ncbi:basic endochitinase-like [Morus notabilis]|uniref:basic endochitinase-like n=1 Tax=Morus notabilis TaxID=981085 RepID=UPI000CECE70D|nr:basic endochitinase-like [Morus notabilis]